jgi:hypothetical protein
MPPKAKMFVLCVSYNKDKRQRQDNQDKEVQIKCKELEKILPRAWLFVM